MIFMKKRAPLAKPNPGIPEQKEIPGISAGLSQLYRGVSPGIFGGDLLGILGGMRPPHSDLSHPKNSHQFRGFPTLFLGFVLPIPSGVPIKSLFYKGPGRAGLETQINIPGIAG